MQYKQVVRSKLSGKNYYFYDMIFSPSNRIYYYSLLEVGYVASYFCNFVVKFSGES